MAGWRLKDGVRFEDLSKHDLLYLGEYVSYYHGTTGLNGAASLGIFRKLRREHDGEETVCRAGM